MAAFYCGRARTGVSDAARVSVRLDSDGRVHLFVGVPDIGQGSNTTMAKIAAEALGLPFEMMRVTSADMELAFDAGPTSATRVTYVVGNAVKSAAITELKELLLDVPSEKEARLVPVSFGDQAYLGER